MTFGARGRLAIGAREAVPDLKQEPGDPLPLSRNCSPKAENSRHPSPMSLTELRKRRGSSYVFIKLGILVAFGQEHLAGWDLHLGQLGCLEQTHGHRPEHTRCSPGARPLPPQPPDAAAAGDGGVGGGPGQRRWRLRTGHVCCGHRHSATKSGRATRHSAAPSVAGPGGLATGTIGFPAGASGGWRQTGCWPGPRGECLPGKARPRRASPPALASSWRPPPSSSSSPLPPAGTGHGP